MTDIKPASTDELHIANGGPAVYSNRFFIQVSAVVKIAFAEQYGPDTAPAFRAAVALSHQDAIELAGVLKTLLADVEQQISEAKAKAEAAANG